MNANNEKLAWSHTFQCRAASEEAVDESVAPLSMNVEIDAGQVKVAASLFGGTKVKGGVLLSHPSLPTFGLFKKYRIDITEIE